jgi:glyoxylase-like metal-dependent hydrolase (beta-lactamase superfamily II)
VLTQVAQGVLVHQSDFLQSNAVVVQGPDGVLLIDPGITVNELACLATDLRESGQSVVAGFATHPHWDHVLWHAEFGEAARYGTERCAGDMRNLLASADWKDQVAEVLPPENAAEIPLELFGLITGLPTDASHVPWDGPRVRVIEHQAHVAGHAALLIEERGVLVAGDMLSDILVPFLELETADPIGDYLTSLQLFEDLANGIGVVVPGHGSVGDAAQFGERIELDRAYVRALRDGGGSDDPRLTTGPHKQWLPGVHEWQLSQIMKASRDTAAA